MFRPLSKGSKVAVDAVDFRVRFTSTCPDIHPASRGVAAHTAGLFRSVRGAKGGFPPWGLFKLRSFNKKSFQNIVFDSVFSNVSSQTDGNLHVFCHKGSKSLQNIAFDSVFVMFPVKHTVIYTFFAITSVQNTCFCSVFNALASKNPAKSCYVQCFFHFWPFFHCRKATKMTQNSISIPSCAQTPKNPRKMSKTPPYSGLGAKPFLGSGLGAKPFLGPPPPS